MSEPLNNAPSELELEANPDAFDTIKELGVTVVVTSHQTNRILALSAGGDTILAQMQPFHNAMAISHKRDDLAIASKFYVTRFRNEIHNIPPLEGGIDAYYVPYVNWRTGMLDTHDLQHTNSDLWMCATLFSSIGTLSDTHNFNPRWSPYFIKLVAPMDACHLNGFALEYGWPRWATAFSVSSEPEGWRQDEGGGVLLEINDDNESRVAIDGLHQPHSPRIHGDTVYFLESGGRALKAIEPNTGDYYSVVRDITGFPRGLVIHGNHAFIGLSEGRADSTFSKQLDSDEKRHAGVLIIDLLNRKPAGYIWFKSGIGEVSNLAILPHKRAYIASWTDEAIKRVVSLPGG